jgi:hypothetical protein
MNREEAIKFLALVKVAYPTAYKDMDKESKLATVNMWHRIFLNVPFKIMEMVFERFIRVSKFPPTVSDIFDGLKSLYWNTLGDNNIAYQEKDSELLRRTEWVLTYTSPYRSASPPVVANYNLLSEEDLQLLPNSETPKLIGREDYD